MVKILGYADRLSVAPGEAVRFMVSCTGGKSYRAEIVRIIHGDANPKGPGLKLEKVGSAVEGEYPARAQGIDAGSYGIVPDHARLRDLDELHRGRGDLADPAGARAAGAGGEARCRRRRLRARDPATASWR